MHHGSKNRISRHNFLCPPMHLDTWQQIVFATKGDYNGGYQMPPCSVFPALSHLTPPYSKRNPWRRQDLCISDPSQRTGVSPAICNAHKEHLDFQDPSITSQSLTSNLCSLRNTPPRLPTYRRARYYAKLLNLISETTAVHCTKCVLEFRSP